MRYPSIIPKTTHRVIVPQLSGGVNVADDPSYVDDHQLTQCENMYFDMGRLRTRPGMALSGEHTTADADIVLHTDEGLFLLNNDGEMCFVDCDGDSVSVVGAQFGDTFDHDKGLCVNVNSSQGNGKNGVLYIGRKGQYVHTYLLERTGSSVAPLGSNLYIPIVLINCKGSDTSTTYSVNGTAFEGYNMLTDSFSILATTGEGKCWHLPRKLQGAESITVSLTDPKYGDINHSIYLPATLDTSDDAINSYASAARQASYVDKTTNRTVTYQQKVAYNARDNCIVFLAKKDSESDFKSTVAPVSVATYKNSSSNMKITVKTTRAQSGSDITDMKCMRWFGGIRGGLGGGSRLFVAGNPDRSGAVYWSDLNRPTYFSENNYAYVGDSSDITALAQQDNMLVIFQANAITVSEYIEGQTPSADSVMSGSVVDVTTLAATFPLTPVHSTVGCDCPDTVQLCSNRLVWLTSEGKVYTLVNYNQYNERNVRELSYAIEPLLKRHSKQELKNAKSADVDGRYCLFVGKKVYLLDYADQTVGGYSGSSRSSRGATWYVWSLPQFMSGVDIAFIHADMLVLIEGQRIYTVDFNTVKQRQLTDRDETGEYPIPCSFTTKLFKFGAPDRLKRVDSVCLGIGNTAGAVTVSSIISGNTDEMDTLSINGGSDHLTSGGVQLETLYPNARGVTDFGISMASESAMSVESMSIIYKETGDIL